MGGLLASGLPPRATPMPGGSTSAIPVLVSEPDSREAMRLLLFSCAWIAAGLMRRRGSDAWGVPGVAGDGGGGNVDVCNERMLS